MKFSPIAKISMFALGISVGACSAFFSSRAGPQQLVDNLEPILAEAGFKVIPARGSGALLESKRAPGVKSQFVRCRKRRIFLLVRRSVSVPLLVRRRWRGLSQLPEHERTSLRNDSDWLPPPARRQPSNEAYTQLEVRCAHHRDAIRNDERREQDVVAFSSNLFYEDPDAPSEFGGQEQLAQKEMNDLEAGNHVSWDEIQGALYVPPDRL